MYVLEDNLRVPSGVSYMLENRQVIKRVFPELFENSTILPVDDYPSQLFDMLAALSPRKGEVPEVVVLTPGIYNSAYFEHSYLARQMGCELVEGRDLAVDSDDCVFMQTVDGWSRVDVIYRRIDDDFLDPEAFREDSSLGVPGLMRAWKKGNVALANAPGAGVADDKLVYTYVPDMIKYYLDEDAILENVPSFRCAEPDQLSHVLAHLHELVVKPVDGSGGYGMLMGPSSTKAERAQFTKSLQGRSAQLRRAAGHHAVDGADAGGRCHRAAPRRPAALHPQWTADQRDHRRPHARRAAQGITGGEFLAGRRQQGHLDRGHGGSMNMLARVVENVYWLSRYMERAENTARIINVNAHLLLDLPKGIAPGWLPLVDISGNRAEFDAKEPKSRKSATWCSSWWPIRKIPARCFRPCAWRARTRARCARSCPPKPGKCSTNSTRSSCASCPRA